MKNCVNCGAPIAGSKCQYCGTEYNGGAIKADFSPGDFTGTLTVGGQSYQVYIASMEANLVGGANTGRYASGRLYIDHGRLLHTFTLIEL